MQNLFLFADETTASPWSSVMTLGILVLVVVVFYFFIIRPQKKQEREASAMRDNLAVGDEVTTIGGIIGQIVSIKGETVTIVTSKDKTKIRFLKNAIRNVDVKANGEVPAGKEAVKANDVEPVAPADTTVEADSTTPTDAQ